jgi:spermidine/putrescine transport system ATP-binding protein
MAQVGIELKNVIKEFPARGGETPVRAVDNVSLTINEGEFFALLGPSGCGKTTTLRMIAGFDEPTSGEILIRGKAVQGVPPFHRPVNTVFQDYALFPHMTVLQNVMFGLEMEGVDKNEAKKRAMEALEMVRLTQFDRKPRQMSGGQQQRVALARALVKRPAVLLLDEPLGALDLKLRKAMQYELMSMQSDLNMTFVYVTHDQEEALTMCDRIAVMDRGVALQVGRPEEIYETPRTRFVADFIGETNFIPGKMISVNGKYASVRIGDEFTINAAVTEENVAAPGSDVTIGVRPEKITVVPEGGTLADAPGFIEREQNKAAIPGEVVFANYIGTDTRYRIRIAKTVEIVVREQNFATHFDTMYKPGQKVTLYWANENARLLAQ